MSEHKEMIRAAATNGVDAHVRWSFTDSGHFTVGGVASAIHKACRFLRESGEEFNYDEVQDAVLDLIYQREHRVRMRINVMLP